MTTRHGFVVNGSACPDPYRLLQWVFSAQPTTMVVMDSYQLAVDIQVAGGGNTKVAHRVYDQAEGGEWKTTTPESYCDALAHWGHPEIYRQVLCEPALRREELPALFSWLSRVLDILRERGFKAVYGNVGVACIPAEWIDAGVMDALLFLEHEHRGWHVLGVHEYTGIELPFGVGQWAFHQPDPIQYFLQTWWHDPGYWPTKEQLPVARWNGQLPPYWHIRRSDWLTIRARELDLGTPQYWVTENGWDSMPDIGSVYPALTDKWSIALGYQNLRGMNSLANVWRAYWPEWSVDRAAFEQDVWLDKVYPENYIGWNRFMWTADHWAQDGFDMSQNVEYLELHRNRAVEPDPPVEPEPEPTVAPLMAALLSVGLFVGFIAVILLGIFVFARLQASAQSAGGNSMEELLNQLFSISLFQSIAYTSAIVYFLVELWKRYLVEHLPVSLRAAPETVAVLLIGLFMVVHGVAVEYQYDNALKEVARFVTDLIGVLGPYVLGGIATSATVNYSYNKLRASQTPGFTARNIVKK